MENQLNKKQAIEPSSIRDTFAWIEEEGSAGRARVRMAVRQRHRNSESSSGSVQGGVLLSLADRAFVNASNTVLDPGYTTVTIELKANLIAAITEGELIADCHLIHSGRRLHVGEVEVKDNTGRLIAVVSGTNLVLAKR